MSWGMRDHIVSGRSGLNFSIWATYGLDRRRRKLEEMCEEVEAGNMPHYQYLWLHRDAILSDSQKDSLCSWTRSALEEVIE